LPPIIGHVRDDAGNPRVPQPVRHSLVRRRFARHRHCGGQTPINVETWPDDVPCDVLKKNPDGSYLVTVPVTRFFVTHNSMQFKNTRETRYWDQKCKGKTQ
jgi:hypothetical protein